MDRDYSNLTAWLESYVNSPSFSQALESTIEKVENPSQRARLMLDLVDYIKPKYKNVDPPAPDNAQAIHITYVLDNKKARNDSAEPTDD